MHQSLKCQFSCGYVMVLDHLVIEINRLTTKLYSLDTTSSLLGPSHIFSNSVCSLDTKLTQVPLQLS